MSWSRRSLLALAGAAAASACGFTPALTPSGGAEGLRNAIDFEAPSNRYGHFLTRRLEERLGLPTSPDYSLRVGLTLGSQVTGIPADSITARTNLVGQADYTLVHLPSGRVVRRGAVQSFTGLSSTSTTAATQAAVEDARRRLMTILADRIVAELLATAPAWRQ